MVATADAQVVDETLVFYEDEENLKKLCNFLRSNEGVPVREAIEMDKRVYYLKGPWRARMKSVILAYYTSIVLTPHSLL